MELQKSSLFQCTSIATGQHPVIVSQIMSLFDLEIDEKLSIFREKQSLSEMYSRAISEISNLFSRKMFDCIIVQGDTSSALAAATASFYTQIPVVHIEAGLRTSSAWNPFPEEMNRRIISQIAEFHFAATEAALSNLVAEGFSKKNIFVSGNTGIDAARIIAEKIDNNLVVKNANLEFLSKRKFVLITMHRRESWASGIKEVLIAILNLATLQPDLDFVFIMHPNPEIQKLVKQNLSGLVNIHIIQPLEYKDMIFLVKKSWLILTDSGGLQEEAPYFDVPVLVARNETERTEGTLSGCSLLVGVDGERITQTILNLLNDNYAYEAMSMARNPYGDGFASQRIVNILEQRYYG